MRAYRMRAVFKLLFSVCVGVFVLMSLLWNISFFSDNGFTQSPSPKTALVRDATNANHGRNSKKPITRNTNDETPGHGDLSWRGKQDRSSDVSQTRHPEMYNIQNETVTDRATERKARVSHLRQECSAERKKRPVMYSSLVGSPSNNYLQAPDTHLLYCAIQKVASSFWYRVFFLLQPHKRNGSVFDSSSLKNRMAGKETIRRNRINEASPESLSSETKFLFVRDPYERLFSGYIDKLFAVTYETDDLTKDVLRSAGRDNTRKGSCDDLFVTFQQFVEYLVRGGEDADVNIHFKPMSWVCPPCFLQYDVIGKLETFKEDVDFILTSAGVEPSDVIGSASGFDENSDMNIMYDVTDRTYDVGDGSCIKKKHKLLRTWVMFQVRGFLSIDEPFPLTDAEVEEITLPAFWSHVKRAYARSGPREVRMLQRKSALMEAYHDLPRRLLKKLEDYVAKDCRMFSYHCDVDSRFDPDSVAEPVFHFNTILGSS